MKSILDQSFRYVPSVETDIRKTFQRARKQQREVAAAADAYWQAELDLLRSKVDRSVVSVLRKVVRS